MIMPPRLLILMLIFLAIFLIVFLVCVYLVVFKAEYSSGYSSFNGLNYKFNKGIKNMIDIGDDLNMVSSTLLIPSTKPVTDRSRTTESSSMEIVDTSSQRNQTFTYLGSDYNCGNSPNLRYSRPRVKVDRLKNGRIFSGNEVEHGSQPWVVSLRTIKDKTLYDHFCGGVLISKILIMTAAHCVSSLNAQQLRVVAGLHTRTDISSYAIKNTYLVKEIILHERFDKSTSSNDIALLVLTKPVETSSNVSTICLPSSTNINDFVGSLVIASGWGLKSNYESSNQLQQTMLTIIDKKDKRCVSSLNAVNKEMVFCAMDTISRGREDKSTLCFGDSGGPLIIRSNYDNKWILVGIISYVSGYMSADKSKYYCDSDSPSYFTSVPYFLEWILKHI